MNKLNRYLGKDLNQKKLELVKDAFNKTNEKDKLNNGQSHINSRKNNTYKIKKRDANCLECSGGLMTDK
ncbi:MAG: hypothetical protein ACON5A_05725 [Candidatus Comchoanobacterales bacterium]